MLVLVGLQRNILGQETCLYLIGGLYEVSIAV